jgi:hypothetical protein
LLTNFSRHSAAPVSNCIWAQELRCFDRRGGTLGHSTARREHLGTEASSGRGNLSLPMWEAPLATAAYRVVLAALLAFWTVVLVEWAGRLLELL